MARWTTIALVAGGLLLAAGLVSANPVEPADGVCFALSEGGPAICPTERPGPISLFHPGGLPADQVRVVWFKTWRDDEPSSGPHVYAWINDYSPHFRHPSEAAAGLKPVRVSESGFTYDTLEGELWYEGERWYLVNRNSPRNRQQADEYVRERNVHFVQPSTFPGLYLPEPPALPFAWIMRQVQPSPAPGALPDPDLPTLHRYDLVTLYEVAHVAGATWYRVGEGQWIMLGYFRRVDVRPRPTFIGPDEKWIDVNLSRQVLAAYEGDRMVFASLISSGLPQWETTPGVFRIYEKVLIAKMSGQHGQYDYYYLEDVPWTMYFFGGTALHGAYWHDSFGYRHSHGCVNLPPIPAQWLYQWTTPAVPDGVNRFRGTGTWVWVH